MTFTLPPKQLLGSEMESDGDSSSQGVSRGQLLSVRLRDV